MRCPYCAENIEANSVKCEYCDEILPKKRTSRKIIFKVGLICCILALIILAILNLTKRRPSDDIVIIRIDDESIEKIGTLSSDIMAKGIRNLDDANAKVIAFAILFTSSQKSEKDKNKEKILIDALEYANCVIGATSIDLFDEKQAAFRNGKIIEIDGQARKITYPPDTLRYRFKDLGFITLYAYEDDIIRSATILDYVYSERKPCYSFSSIIAANYLNTSPEELNLPDNIIINFHRKKHKSYSFHSIYSFSDEKMKEFFKDKIVIIGLSMTDFLTPIGKMTATEIHATIVDNILNTDYKVFQAIEKE